MNEPILERFELLHEEETRLYERAKREGWNASTDIDWSQPIGWPEGVDREVARAYRRYTLSEFFYGEQVALAVCGQLIPLCPDLSARLHLATQALDEARHIEVFGRYLNLIGGPTRTGPHLKCLFQALLGTPNLDEKLVGTQVVTEGLLLDAFRARMASTPDGLLRQILSRVAQDESRHLAFSLLLCQRRLQTASPKRRKDIERAAASYASDLIASTRWRNPDLPPGPGPGPNPGQDREGTTPALSASLLKGLSTRLQQLGMQLPL